MQDIHSHILPGVDHGARDLQQSIRMLEAARAQGIDRIVATPHVYRAGYDFGAAQRAADELRPHAQQRGIELLLGYEFNLSALDQRNVKAALRFCTQGSSMLLLEMPFDTWPIDWWGKIYEMQSCGIEIVLAHPERYEPIRKDLRLLEKLAQLDVKFQVDVPQSLKRFSKQNRVLRELCAMDRLNYAASDAHEEADYAAFAKSIRRLEKYLKEP